MPREFVAFGLFVDDLGIFRDGILIIGYNPGGFMAIQIAGGSIRIEDEFLRFDQLSGHIAYLEALQQRDQSKFGLNRSSVDDGFAGCADGVFDLIRPDICDSLSSRSVPQHPRQMLDVFTIA